MRRALDIADRMALLTAATESAPASPAKAPGRPVKALPIWRAAAVRQWLDLLDVALETRQAGFQIDR